MDKVDRMALAPQVMEVIKDIQLEINKDLLKMLSESPDKAVSAHYEYLALNRIVGKIQQDINAGKREERK